MYMQLKHPGSWVPLNDNANRLFATRQAPTAVQPAGNVVVDGHRTKRSSTDKTNDHNVDCGDNGGGDICGYAPTDQGIGRGQFGKTEIELWHRVIAGR